MVCALFLVDWLTLDFTKRKRQNFSCVAAILLVEWLTCDCWPKNQTACAPFLWFNGWLWCYRKNFNQCVRFYLLTGWLCILFRKAKLKLLDSLALIRCMRFRWLTGWLWILEKDKGKISHVWLPYCWLNSWLVISDQKIKLCVRRFFGWMVDLVAIGKKFKQWCLSTH